MFTFLFFYRKLAHSYSWTRSSNHTSYCLTLSICMVFQNSNAQSRSDHTINYHLSQDPCALFSYSLSGIPNRSALDFMFVLAEICWSFAPLCWKFLLLCQHYALCFAAPIIPKNNAGIIDTGIYICMHVVPGTNTHVTLPHLRSKGNTIA